MKIFKSAQLGNISYGGDSSHQLRYFFQPMRDFAAPELFPVPHPRSFPEKRPRTVQPALNILSFYFLETAGQKVSFPFQLLNVSKPYFPLPGKPTPALATAAAAVRAHKVAATWSYPPARRGGPGAGGRDALSLPGQDRDGDVCATAAFSPTRGSEQGCRSISRSFLRTKEISIKLFS